MFKRHAKVLIRLRVCSGWYGPSLVAHTTLLEISCHGSSSVFSRSFFQALGRWAATLDHVSLLDTAARLVDKALSCGYTGLVMLHGMLSRIPLSSWEPRLYGNYHPSYYGMMSASYHLRSNTC